ncbi:MAG: hypothetical protein ACI959_001382 [Limisphaerales bacterium]|jgi:hypothetical protein
MQYDIPDPVTGRIKHFKVEFDTRFADVVLKGKKQKITREQVDAQLLNIEDANGWLKLLDSERYEFQGFAIMNWGDITFEVNFSLIQQTLLENTTEMNTAQLDKLENNIK